MFLFYVYNNSKHIDKMVTIDDEGNKVNGWVEYRFDTTTNEVVEVKHATILAEADDEEHWMSRITYDTIYICSFIPMYYPRTFRCPIPCITIIKFHRKLR